MLTYQRIPLVLYFNAFFPNWISTLIKKIADYHFVIGILSSIINTNQRCFIFKRSQNILPVKKINLWSNVKEDQLFISRHRSYQKLCLLIPLYFNSYLLYVTEFCFFKTYWNKIDADYKKVLQIISCPIYLHCLC